MAYLTVPEQTAEIHRVGVLLGHSHETLDAMITKRDGDRLALNKLRVQLTGRHRTVCAQINRAAENKEAKERATLALVKHDATLEQAARDRRRERDQLAPGIRVDRALTALRAMSTVRAATLPDPNLTNVKMPRAAGWQEPAEAPQVDVAPILAGLTYLVEQLELVLDAERGLLAPQELAKLPGDIKDRVILTQLQGVHADTIAGAMPWLGSSVTIRRVRREAGQRPVDGTDRPASLTA